MIITVVAGILLLLQVAFIVIAVFRKSKESTLKIVQAGTATAILSPIIFVILLLIGIHLKRIAPFEPISILDAFKQSVPECGILCQIGSLRLFAGVSLIALSFIGIFSLATNWWKNRHKTNFGICGNIVGLGINLAGVIIGLGVYQQDLKAGTIRQLFGREEVPRQLIAKLKAFDHSFVLDAAIWICVLLCCSIIIAVVRSRKDQLRHSRNALVCGIFVCAMGVVAFIITRNHVQDSNTTMNQLVGKIDEFGNYSVPDKIESAVFGEMWAMDWIDGNFKLDPSIELPESSSMLDYKWAINVNISQTELKVEGNTIAKLNNGIVESKYFDLQKQRIRPLHRLLRMFKEIEAKESINPTGDETVICLQADKSVPFETLDQIVKSTSQAGYPNFRLVVLRKDQRPLSRQRVAVINVSAPTFCLEESEDAVFGFYRKSIDTNDEPSDGEDTPGLDPQKLLAKRISPSDGVPLDRFAKVNIEDVRLENPEDDETESLRFTLYVQIANNGFTLSANGVQQGDELERLHFEIPKENHDFNFQALAKRIKEIHDKHPKSDTVIIRAERDVPFSTIVQTLDATRERIVDKKLATREFLFTNACITSIGVTTSSQQFKSTGS
jgi:biopolymer transport protein ExbD